MRPGLQSSGSETAIRGIRFGAIQRRPKFLGLAASVLGAALCLASNASAGQRVSLLGFEGDSAAAIRWRVAQILKRAGHVVIGFAPPRNDSADELRRYAKKRRVNAFVAGSAEEGSDGWELTLSVRGADGSSMGRALTFNAPTLGALVKELKAEGQGKLDRVVKGRAPSKSDDVDLDAESEPSDEVAADDSEAEAEAWDADDPRPKKQKKSKTKTKAKKKGKRASLERRARDERRAAAESLDEDSPLDRELRARRAKARRASTEKTEEAGSDPLAGAAEITLDEDEPEKPAPKAKKKRFGLSSWGSSETTPDTETTSEPEVAAEQSSASKRSLASRSESESPAEEAEADSSEDSTSSKSSEGESETEVGADEATSEEPSAGAGRLSTAVIGVDAGLVRRDLDYTGDIYGRQRTPRTNAWVYRIDAAFYPFARPVKDRIALVAGYESAFSGKVRDNDVGADFSVNLSELFGGVRLRQPLGKHEVGVSGTVGVMSAGLDDPDGASRVPEFSYTVLSPTIDLGLDFGAVGVRTALGYRKTFGDFGQVSDTRWFPRMTGYGMDGKLELQYRYSEEVAFELSGTMRRYVLEMNSVPQDAIDGTSEVAGGAIDRYLGAYFGINLTL